MVPAVLRVDRLAVGFGVWFLAWIWIPVVLSEGNESWIPYRHPLIQIQINALGVIRKHRVLNYEAVRLVHK